METEVLSGAAALAVAERDLLDVVLEHRHQSPSSWPFGMIAKLGDRVAELSAAVGPSAIPDAMQARVRRDRRRLPKKSKRKKKGRR